MSRTEYEAQLSGLLKETYEKNSPNMYRLLALKGDQARAIQWARKLHVDSQAAGTPSSKANPCTTVYELVDKLNGFQPRRVTVEET